MKLLRAPRADIRSATIVTTLVTMACLSAFCVLTVYASDPAAWNDPAWWTHRNAVAQTVITTNNSIVTTNYAPNNNAIANQGQLKQVTAAAYYELSADLTNSGGAGAPLSNLVYGWQQDYLTNHYATNTGSPYKPSDLQAVNVGQVKYIANLVYSQLASAGYTGLYPSWLASSNAADMNAANLGQLKKAFDFDLNLVGPANLTTTPNTNGVINLAWTVPPNNAAINYTIEQQTQNGDWEVIATLANATAYAVTNLSSGEHPEFRIIGQSGFSVSIAQTTPPDTHLAAPSNVTITQGAADGEADVNWQNNATDATYIQIHQSSDGVNWTTIATLTDPTTTYYPVTNLTVGQNYYFSVSAGNN